MMERGFNLAAALVFWGTGLAFAQTDLRVVPVQGNVYMLVGAGGNITLQVAKEGVLIVDTGLAQMSDKVLAAIRQLSDKPIRYIVNTHVHPDLKRARPSRNVPRG
jgi:glyoxylase-like metal-dependent hydrolase (beta-lactamase superfamily II)